MHTYAFLYADMSTSLSLSICQNEWVDLYWRPSVHLPLRLCCSISNLTTASRVLSFPSFTVYSAPIFRSALLVPSVIFIVEVTVVCSVYVWHQKSYKFTGISEIVCILNIFDQDPHCLIRKNLSKSNFESRNILHQLDFSPTMPSVPPTQCNLQF